MNLVKYGLKYCFILFFIVKHQYLSFLIDQHTVTVILDTVLIIQEDFSLMHKMLKNKWKGISLSLYKAAFCETSIKQVLKEVPTEGSNSSDTPYTRIAQRKDNNNLTIRFFRAQKLHVFLSFVFTKKEKKPNHLFLWPSSLLRLSAHPWFSIRISTESILFVNCVLNQRFSFPPLHL